MKNFYKIGCLVWKYLKPNKYLVFLFAILSLIDSMVGLIYTYILGQAIDHMILAGDKTIMLRYAIIFLMISFASFIVAYFAKTRGQKVMELAVKECKLQLIEHIEKTSLRYIESVGTSSFMERMSYDIQLLIMFVLNTGSQIPENIIVFGISVGIIMYIDVTCGIIALLELPIIVILYLLFRRKIFFHSRKVAKKREEEYSKLCETVTDLAHIKKNQIGNLLHDRYIEKANDFICAVTKKVRISCIYKVLNDNVETFLKIFLFFYGGFKVIDGTMTVGGFTIIYSYYTMLTSVCSYFLNVGEEIEGTMAYYERIQEIENVQEETNGTIQINEINKIELSNVYFGYSENEMILENFTQSFHKGKLYVVVGGNGCGKSTMVSLILGMYIEEYQGKITYNGYSIKELDMRMLRKEHIGICEQEPYLIEDTIRYNMIYSNNTMEDDKLRQLAHQMSFDEFLNDSEKGLDTQVGECGNALSGGQKQKTALVKVFYKNPKVMILDEPTSAMDMLGQERLFKYLNEIKKDKIIIVITHDENILKIADEVIRM